ncbi:MAG: hypothetical protein GY854_05080 [Deltaproteobacteria bacterium]|nr:hypothetical protein [Deltaproteobacteria bacterium]
MPRPFFGAIGTILGLVWIAVLFLGCGGATASGGNDPAASSGDPGETAAAEAAEDPKVKEARERCDAEITQSDLQPPDQLSKLMVHACIYATRPEVAKCTRGPKREIVIKIVVEKTGEVSNAFAVGDTADGLEAKCVAEVVGDITFPKFKGLTQQILKYPFTLGKE